MMFHRASDFRNDHEGLFIYFIHKGLWISWSKASEVHFIQKAENDLLLLNADLLFFQAFFYTLAVQLREGDVVFVGKTSPQSTVDFLVERFRLSCLEVCGGLFKASACQREGVAFTLGNRVDIAFAVLQEPAYDKEDDQKHSQGRETVEKDRFNIGVIGGLCVCLSAVVGIVDSVAGHHVEMLLFDRQGDIFPCRGVEKDELVGGNGDNTFLLGNDDPFEGATATDSVVVTADFILSLGVIDLEGSRELRRWRVDEHEVSMTRNGEPVTQCLARLHAVECQTARDREIANGIAVVIGGRGESLHVHLDLFCLDMLFNGLCRVEERVVEEVEHGARTTAGGLDNGQNVDVERVDDEFSALLGEEGATAYLGHLVATTVHDLLILFYPSILRRQILGPEPLVSWLFVNGIVLDGY